MLLFLASSTTGTAEAIKPESDAATVAESRSYFDTPRSPGNLEPADNLPDWYNTW